MSFYSHKILLNILLRFKEPGHHFLPTVNIGRFQALGEAVNPYINEATGQSLSSHLLSYSLSLPFSVSLLHGEATMSHGDGDATVVNPERQQSENGLQQPSEAQSAFLEARQRRKIAELEGKIETLESGRASKERYVRQCMRWVGYAQ